MATESADRISSHRRGMTVTSLASIAGILAGVASASLASGPSDTLAVLILGVAVSVQFPILKAVGIDVNDFGGKDFLYVAFMTFALWFISWGILLTSSTPV
ncbi:MAG: hypothetical protein ABEI96_11415 [Haloarculaceae archaeon]